MPRFLISFMGAIQDKVKARKLVINTDGNVKLREIMQLILDQIEEAGKESYIKYVWNPEDPDRIQPGMAMLLDGLHVPPGDESLERELEKDGELSIFPPLAGG